MAIVTGQAKLYIGVRSWCVDKNISANLSAAFSIGNKDIDFPTDVPDKDAQGNDVIYPNVYIWRLRRAVADMICPRPQPVLANERYKTYGGGNNVITSEGVDNTNNWKVTPTLTCQFPTYIEIDVEKLQLPEGTTVTLNFEEGWLYEDRGRKLPSGAWEYPNAVQDSPSPEAFNYVTFRTPWYGVAKLNSVFNRNIIPLRIKQLAANFPQALGAVTFRIRYSPGRFASLFVDDFNVSAAGKAIFRPVLTLYSFTGEGSLQWNPFNYRIRGFDSVNNNMAFTVPNIPDGRVRFGVTSMSAATAFVASGIREIGPITASISSASTINCNAVKITNIVETEPIVSSVSANVDKISGILNQNLTVFSSLSGEGDVPMVFTWTTTTANETRFLPVFFGNINAQITWGDGQTETRTQTPTYNPTALSANLLADPLVIKHTYANPGTYTVTIGGYIQHWGFVSKANMDAQGGRAVYRDVINRVKVQSWGYIGIETLVGAFWDHMIYRWNPFVNPGYAPIPVPSRLPNTCKDISWMFWQTSSDGGGYAPGGNVTWVDNQVANWNTSNVEYMEGTFFRCRGGFNTNLGSWNVSNVKSFASMFYFSGGFSGQGLNNWNTASAQNMSYMFYFSGMSTDIPNWDVSNVTNFVGMFAYSNGVINTNENTITSTRVETIRLWNWDLSSAPNRNALELMLYGAGGNINNDYRFTSDLSYWCVPNVTSTPLNFWYPYEFVSQRVAVEPRWGTCPTGPRPVVTSVTFDNYVVNEGQTITMTVNVSNTLNSTVYYRMNFNYTGNWEYANNFGTSYAENTGNTAPDDFNTFTGTINIVNGVGTLTITIADNDDWVEGTEYFRVDILSQNGYITPNSSNPLLLAQSPTVTILP